MAVDGVSPEVVSRRLIELSLTRPPVHSFNRQLVRIVLDTVGAVAATLWLLRENELVMVEELEERAGTLRGIGLSTEAQQQALRRSFEKGEVVVLADVPAGRAAAPDGQGQHNSVAFLPVVGLQGNLGALRLVFGPVHPVVLGRQVQLAETLSGYYSLYSAQRILTAQHEERQDIDRLSKAILQLQHYTFSRQIAEVIVNSAAEVARIDRAVLITARKDRELRIDAVSSVTQPDKKGAWARLACELGELVLKAGKPMQFFAGTTDPEQIDDEEVRQKINSYVLMTEVKSLLIFPLTSREDKAGVLMMEGFNEQLLTPFERVLSAVYASHAASALVNARLFRQVPFAGLLSRRFDDDIEKIRRGRSRLAKAAKALLIVAAVAAAVWFVAIHKVADKVGAECLVEPVDLRLVTAPLAGQIERVLFRKGSDVRKGQLLLVLRKDLLERQLDAEVKKADAIAKEIQEKRGRAALRTISAQERNQLLAEVRIREDDLAAQGKQVELVRLRLADCDVTSPIDGTVIDPEEPEKLRLVQVREGMQLCRVARLSRPFRRLKVQFAVPASRAEHIAEGSRIELDLPALGGGPPLVGRVNGLSQQADAPVLTAEATVEVEDTEERPARIEVGAAGSVRLPGEGASATNKETMSCRVTSVTDRLREIRIKAAVPASRVQEIAVGMPAEVQLRSLIHEAVLEGLVESIRTRSENYKNTNVFMANVRVEMKADDERAARIKPGMTGKVKIVRPAKSTYLRIYGGLLYRRLSYWLF